MEKVKGNYEQIVTEATEYLKERFLRADSTLKVYQNRLRGVKNFMDSLNIRELDATVCRDYLLKEFNNRGYQELTRREKEIVGIVSILIEFLETGVVQSKKEQIKLDGPIGALMIKFLTFKTNQRLHKNTIFLHECHLSRFLHFLQKNNVEAITSVRIIHILDYITSISKSTKVSPNKAIQVLRGFFRYLHTSQILETDFSIMIPRSGFKARPKLPSTYSKEEIEKLIASIERSSFRGRRDYAIILLAARLGLRNSDITNLKFENIYWEQNLIRLFQQKTGAEIELPLLPEVGNAIIDYLKYSRQHSEEPNVFLTSRSPVKPLTIMGVTSIVQRAFASAGIETTNKHHGPHALRHSLAQRLLEQQTMLPVISEVLGHKNTESTRFYLRVDLTSMRQCALDVPAVSPLFYSQKGGIFYE